MRNKQRTSTTTTYTTVSPFQDKLWFNFLLSFALLIIAFVARIISEIQYVSTTDLSTNPFGYRGLSTSIGYLCGLLLIWFFVLRKKLQVAKIFAGLLGINVFVMFIIVPLIRTDLINITVSKTHYLFYLYISLSHLMFALFYKSNTSKTTVISYSKNIND